MLFRSSYSFYNSKIEYEEGGILLDVHTIGGGGLQENDNRIHHIYEHKLKGKSTMMLMLSSYDHSFIEPLTPNKNFENYIVKFDPVTKEILAVMAKQKSTSKGECDGENWFDTFEKFYKEKMIKKGLITRNKFTALRIFKDEPNYPDSTTISNVIAGFGFTCADELFGKSRWIHIINYDDEVMYYDNLYSILLSQKNKNIKIKEENDKKSGKFKGL